MREAKSKILAAREAERAEREAKGESAPSRRTDPPPSKADPGLAMPRKHGVELERGRPEIVERILKLMDELRKEQARTTEMGLAEEELEIYDLLIQGRQLTKAEEQKVILAAKNLYKKLVDSRKDILVVEWYKDEQPREKVRAVIQETLNADLPESYDNPVFDAKTNLLLSHFVDMAVQGYGWISAA